MRGQATGENILYGQTGPRSGNDPLKGMKPITDKIFGFEDADGVIRRVRVETGGEFWLPDDNVIDKACTIHVKNGDPHRLDGPAVIYDDGTLEWYQDGRQHRDHGPATTTPDGDQYYYQRGKLHRDDAPAVIETYLNLREWRHQGVLHRHDGPAIDDDQLRQWYLHGQRHRLDGPAIEPVDSRRTLRGEEYWIYGEKFDDRDEWEQRKTEIEETVHILSTDAQNRPTHIRLGKGGQIMLGPDFDIDSPCHIYLQDGVPHRHGEPAIIYDSGSEQWMQHGQNHRDDGPASITVDIGFPKRDWSCRSWWVRGEQHREDGPAFEAWDGSIQYSWRGRKCADKASWELLKRLDGAVEDPRPWWEQE